MQRSLVNGRYGIVSTLGDGGMAKVYLAHDEVLDRDVALKVLREPFADDEEFAERFKREAKSAASLSHPNIVSVYDRGEEDGTSYIAMEYVPGGTLMERIRQNGPLDRESALSVALQVAEALQAAHERGVIHRDIKPHNVLITPSGEAKVADFGIARAASAATISQKSVVMGTASYMSPEQALGKPVSPESDLYSLGVVLYEMLTGELPFQAENPVAVSMKHVTEPLRPPREVNPEIPEDLNAVVVRLLAKQPEDRYRSAAELADDIRQLRQGLPTLAENRLTADPTRISPQTTAPLPPARRRPWRMNPVLAAIGALLLLAGAAGLLLSQGLWNAGSPPEKASTKLGVAVPDVEGLTEEQARQKLESSGFKVDAKRQGSSEADAGVVVDQSPPSGETRKRGSTVTIVVGNGPATVGVPDVVGMSLSKARDTLEGADLALGTQSRESSDTAAVGEVVEQGYRAGTQVKPGTRVDLVLSSGPKQAAPAPQPAPSSASSATGTATATSTPTATAAPTATATAAPTATAPAERELGDDSGSGGGGNSGSGGGGNSGHGGD